MIDAVSFTAGLISWPALLIAILFLMITIEIAYDLGFVAVMTIAVFALLAWYVDLYTVEAVLAAWPVLLMWAGGYVLIGLIWGCTRWALYVRSKLVTARETMRINPRFAKEKFRTAPRVSEHKSDIIRWMSFWPFSIIVWVLGDLFRDLWNALYDYMTTFLQRISDRIWMSLQLPPAEPIRVTGTFSSGAQEHARVGLQFTETDSGGITFSTKATEVPEDCLRAVDTTIREHLYGQNVLVEITDFNGNNATYSTFAKAVKNALHKYENPAL